MGVITEIINHINTEATMCCNHSAPTGPCVPRLTPKQVKDVEDDEAVYRPKHYAQYKIEPWTFIMLNNLPFDVGSIIKYVMRWREKNGVQDLKKARRIIDMMIELEENRAAYTPEKGCL
jgi:hypothetical protein